MHQQLVADICWTFVLPCVCLFSISTNTLSVIVFYTLRMRKAIYQLLFVKSCVNVSYLFICFWKFLSKCGRFCDIIYGNNIARENWMFAIQLYDFGMFGILTHILGLCDVLIELTISIKRYYILTERRDTRILRMSINSLIFGIFFISILIYLPDIAFARIVGVVKEDNNTLTILNSSETKHGEYSASSRIKRLRLEISNPILYKNVIGFKFFIFRTSLTLFLIVFMNVLNIYQMKNKVQFIQGSTTNPSTNMELRPVVNFNLMLMYQSFVYIFGNWFYIVAYAIWLIDSEGKNTTYINITTNTLLFFSLGLNGIVYLIFDRLFRMQTLYIFTDRSNFTRD